MNDNSTTGLIGWIGTVVILYFVTIYIILPVALIFAGIGSILGSGHAVVNYFIAFNNNVKWE